MRYGRNGDSPNQCIFVQKVVQGMQGQMTAVNSYCDALTWRPQGSISPFLREPSKSSSLVGSVASDENHELPDSSEDVLLKELMPDLYNRLNAIAQEQSLADEKNEQCGLGTSSVVWSPWSKFASNALPKYSVLKGVVASCFGMEP